MEAFKNIFNEKFVNVLAFSIKKYDKSFEDELYINSILKTLDDLELKARMRLISTSIKPYLHISYKKSLEVLKKAKLEVEKINKDVENLGLQTMIFPDFVEVYGLDDFDLSMDALEVFTNESSSEFAVRHFIMKDEKKAMKYFYSWMKSENEHVRRLASEGSRPRLPWAIALPSFKKDPSLVLPILNELKNDESLYVRRSVANNLNDIAKDNEKIVIDFIQKNIGKTKELDWLVKHGARTLLKKSDIQTLELFGYKKLQYLEVNNFALKKEIKVGEYLDFSFSLSNDKSLGKLRLEYEIDFIMSNNKRSKKVFMISQGNVKDNKKIINKKHSFKKITTRKFYEGKHYLTIIVNGTKKGTLAFILNL